MYRVVYINGNDEKDTIEAEDFEYGENGIARIVVSYEGRDDIVKYIPIHRLVLIEGIELWVAEKDDEDDDDKIEKEAGELEEEEADELED